MTGVLTGAGMRPRIDQQISSVLWRGTWTMPSHRVERFIGTCLCVFPTAAHSAHSARSRLRRWDHSAPHSAHSAKLQRTVQLRPEAAHSAASTLDEWGALETHT